MKKLKDFAAVLASSIVVILFIIAYAFSMFVLTLLLVSNLFILFIDFNVISFMIVIITGYVLFSLNK